MTKKEHSMEYVLLFQKKKGTGQIIYEKNKNFIKQSFKSIM